MKRLLPSAALVAAAALTFSLAAPATAQADEASVGRFTAAPAPTSTTPATVAGITGGTVTITSPGYIYYSTYASAGLAVSVAVTPDIVSWRVYGDVYVNGVLAAARTSLSSSTYAAPGVSWPRAAGYGNVQLRGITVEMYNASYTKTTAALPDSNVQPVLRTIDGSAQLKIRKRGSKAVALARGWKVYQPDGSQIKVGPKVILQRKVKGKWRKVKKIKINAAGNGKVKFKQKKTYKYRIFVASTADIQSGWTKPFKL